MTQQEKEYQEFYAKLMKLTKEFSDEFQKLSPENKQRFQENVAALAPLEWTSFWDFLSTKF